MAAESKFGGRGLSLYFLNRGILSLIWTLLEYQKEEGEHVKLCPPTLAQLHLHLNF